MEEQIKKPRDVKIKASLKGREEKIAKHSVRPKNMVISHFTSSLLSFSDHLSIFTIRGKDKEAYL